MVSIRQSHINDDSETHWLELINLNDEQLVTMRLAIDFCQDLDENLLFEQSREMVEILAGLNMDPETLATAYLTPFYLRKVITIENVEDKLGNSLASLLKGVFQMATISTLAHQNKGTVQIDNIRRMLLAMVEDVRAVVIKLAEQVCHLRSVKNANEEERVIAAKETSSIFAPLANRLGIGQIKWELEYFSFRYLHPEYYKKIAKLLDDKRLNRESYMTNMVASIQSKLDEANVDAQVDGRPKHIFSIYKKMYKKNYDFEQLFDIRAIRVVVDHIQDCYAALGIVHTNWQHLHKEFDDYIATPKPNGYQSIHTVVLGPEGKTVEVQIRTQAMHENAELGVAAHWKYKEGLLPSKKSGYDQKINWLRSLLQWQEEVVDDSSLADDMELAEELKNQVIEDRAYVFTPSGDIVDLPLGSTPLDFAYYIHSNVGHRCIGAKIFGKIVPFTHQLVTGNQIEILTKKEPSPSRDWLNPSLGYIKSSRARAKIHHWFKQQDRDKNLAAGKEIADAELIKHELTNKELEGAVKRFNFNQVDELLVAIGAGDVRLAQFINYLQSRQVKDDIPKFKHHHKACTTKGDKNGIVVDGVGSLMSHVAGCCQPVPGDTISGYITLGRGIAVHRNDCEQFIQLCNSAPERVTDVSWAEDVQTNYALTIRIEANDRPALMRDISSVLANERINVLNMSLNTQPQKQLAIFDMKLEITDLSAMNRVLTKVRQIEGVYEAMRHH